MICKIKIIKIVCPAFMYC